MKIPGGCLCGGFRFALHEEPHALGDCHCIDCRRSSGAPYVTWGTVRREQFEVTQGALRKVPFAGRIRGFAQCCGTHMLFEETATAPTVDVAIGTLDDPRPYPPTKAIWVEDKLPWTVLDPRVPSFPKDSGPA